MQTMQEQPGRCLGCRVVVATDEDPGSLMLPPTAAPFVAASTFPRDSTGLRLVTALLLVKSAYKCCFSVTKII